METAGVTLYQLTPQTLVPYRNLTALAMEQRAEGARFEALLLGAERYLAAGGDPVSLSPRLANPESPRRRKPRRGVGPGQTAVLN